MNTSNQVVVSGRYTTSYRPHRKNGNTFMNRVWEKQIQNCDKQLYKVQNGLYNASPTGVQRLRYGQRKSCQFYQLPIEKQSDAYSKTQLHNYRVGLSVCYYTIAVYTSVNRFSRQQLKFESELKK